MQALQSAFSLCCTARPRLVPSWSERGDERLETGLAEGSAVVARLHQPNSPPQFIYGTLDSKSPLSITSCEGATITSDEVQWAAAAKDDGWLAPYGKEWQEPGRILFMRLLKDDEWVAARTATRAPSTPVAANYLPLEGVEGLEGVDVCKEVGMLFTPHEECQEEFKELQPGRGGVLVDHLAKAFVLGSSKSQQRLRWVQKCRTEAQYPMRCIWVHPLVKSLGLREFVRRCCAKAEAQEPLAPEIVMLLGPPAAGKSSIQRLPPEQVPETLKGTVRSLKFREEVNNDNLCDCMPGFRAQFQVALGVPKESQAGGAHWRKMMKVVQHENSGSWNWAVQALTGRSQEHKSAIAWAMQWLTYAMFHHGPVRDSLAWDVIKVTIVEAKTLPVYYSSVMAGAALDRTMEILELAHSPSKPVPHPPLRVVGFWPYASQEARHARQRNRHRSEKEQQRLLGGNIDSNLVNLHFHAQQAESNITKMLKSLRLGQRPSDGETVQATDIKVDRFIVIDNDAVEPRILLDFTEQCTQRKLRCEQEEVEASKKLLRCIAELPQWDEFCCALFRCLQFFLPKDDADLAKVAGKSSQEPFQEPEQVLPVLQQLDESVFQILTKDSPAIGTAELRPEFSRVRAQSGMLETLGRETLLVLKEHLTDLRMMCVIKALRDDQVAEDGEEEDDADAETSPH
ncbi:unnamed protein product [Durusdinium trenchii]|uniref:Uncharacterized protein n=1 Tax=Durusdinium trenchii TaxID=1381693 RepID=A0ABP0SPY1_9DINO